VHAGVRVQPAAGDQARAAHQGLVDRCAEAYEAEIAGFVRATAGGENRCPWPEAYESLRLAVAAERSLLERRRVELRDVA
jgi:predicted dehydrogenase